jgi:tripartite-type tricarboxylate transporter receptor subunit TctC
MPKPARKTPVITEETTMTIVRLSIAMWCLLMGWAGVAHADDYPNRYIRIIVGPGLDTPARLFGAKIAEVLGTQVIVEPRPGAGGAIAAATVANAPPDGYTLLLATAAYTINTATGQSKYDLRRDFTPIGHVTDVKYVLVLHPSVPAKTLPELIAYSKANPGKMNYASTGIGTPPHLAGEMFKTQTGLDIVHVPFRDPNSAISTLIGGGVQMMFALAATAEPQIRSGLLNGIGVSSVTPSPFVPELQPMAKLGLPNFDVLGWNGLVAPRGTPDSVIAKLNDAIQKGLADPELRKAILASGYEPTEANSPQDFGKFIEADTKKWIDLVQLIGMKSQ